MAFKMKYTNGKKADTSSFPFKVEAKDSVSDSPNKSLAGAAGMTGKVAGAAGGIGLGTAALVGGGGLALLGGVNYARRLADGTVRDEKNYEDEIAEAGLERNFFGKFLGIGGGNAKAREQLIRDLKEKDQMGIDRERIIARGGTVAGA